MNCKCALTLFFLLLLCPLLIYGEESINLLVKELNEAVKLEIERYNKEVRTMTEQESFSNLRGETVFSGTDGRLIEILMVLPRPEEGSEPEVHYRFLLEGIIDHRIINPIVLSTHSALISRNSTDSSLVLTETMSFIENLSELKIRFINRAVPLLVEENSPAY